MTHANPTCLEAKSPISASLRRSFLIFSLAVAISVVNWAGTAAFFIPGFTSIASAFRGALVGKTGPQNVGHLSNTALSWNTEVYDTDNFHSGGNDYFVIPAGVTRVRLSGSVLWSDNTNSGSRFLYTTRNGGFVPEGRAVSAIPKTQAFVMGQVMSTAVLAVSPGQIFRLRADQDSGITTSVLNSPVTWFAIEVLP